MSSSLQEKGDEKSRGQQQESVGGKTEGGALRLVEPSIQGIQPAQPIPRRTIQRETPEHEGGLGGCPGQAGTS